METEKDQHFMVDRDIISRIVSLASIGKGEEVLEIGAGTGNLTEALARAGGKIAAIEIDPSLIPSLKERLRPFKNVKIISGNGLDYLKKSSPEKIVSNIPYAICEPLFRILYHKGFSMAVLTVPKGFLDRPTTSFYTEAFLEIEKAFDVPRKAFLNALFPPSR